MIEHELMLLGLLKENPKHGYEIKKEIKEIFSLFAGINLKSIYYPLRILEEKGLVLKRAVKSGKRPLRYVYQLTARGESRFKALLAKSLLDFTRPQFSIDLSLYFLNYLKPAVARRRLRARSFILRQVSKSLGQMTQSFRKRKPLSLSRILDHNLKMLEAESLFLSNLTKTL